jgi:hypothetical protein
MRRLIICVTLVIVIGVCLYPPWLRTCTFRTFKEPLSSRYALLFTPPEKPQPDNYRELGYWKQGWAFSASIDIRRLSVQCAIVILVGGGLAFLYRSKDKKNQ